MNETGVPMCGTMGHRDPQRGWPVARMGICAQPLEKMEEGITRAGLLWPRVYE